MKGSQKHKVSKVPKSPVTRTKEATPKSSPEVVAEESNQLVQGVKRVRNSIKEQIQNINRPLSQIESKQIDFLERIQQQIFTHLSVVTAESLKQLLQFNRPPVPLECALMALQTLFQVDSDTEVDQTWRSVQDCLRGNEFEFLVCIERFQDLTINHQFERQHIIKAKNHLLRYLVDDQLPNNPSSKTQLDEVPPALIPKLRTIVCLTENIIGFIEVYDALIKSFILMDPNASSKKTSHTSKQLALPPIDESQNEQSKLDEIKTEIIKEEVVEKKPQKEAKVQKDSKTLVQAKKAVQQQPRQRLNKTLNSQTQSIKQSEQGSTQKLDQVESDLNRKKRVLSANVTNSKRAAKLSPKPPKSVDPQLVQQDEEPKQLSSQNSQMKVPNSSPHRNQQQPQLNQSEVAKLIQEKIIVHEEDENIRLLRELIETNKTNIKELMSQQVELKWKIEQETQHLEKNMGELMDKNEQIIQESSRPLVQTPNDRHQSRQEVRNSATGKMRPNSKQVQSLHSPERKKVPVARVNKIVSEIVASNQSFEKLKQEINQNEADRVNLEKELNRLLMIIDEKSKSMGTRIN